MLLFFFSQDVHFAKVYNVTPNVFVSANHSTKGGNMSPIHNGITAWVEVRKFKALFDKICQTVSTNFQFESV